MCGIAGFTVKQPGRVARLGMLADELLMGIAPRGRDATGILAMTANAVTIQKDVVPAPRFIEGRKRFPEDVLTVLLHTRYATVGSAGDVRCAHPVVNGRHAAVHNGTIWNDRELFAEIGAKRNADVDSEVIPALVGFAGWDNAQDILGLTLGGAASAVVNADKTNELILFRTSGFPLVFMETDDILVWASTRAALVGAWQATYGKVQLGTITEMADWTLTRVVGGEVASTVAIEQDDDPPGFRPERPKAKRPSWDKGTRRSVTKTRNAGRPAASPLPWSNRWQGERDTPSQHDILDAEFEQLVMETAGRWSEDGAWEQDEDVRDFGEKSVFAMTEDEFNAWCTAQGWDDIDYDDLDDAELIDNG